MGAKVQIDVVEETTSPFCNLYSPPTAFANSARKTASLEWVKVFEELSWQTLKAYAAADPPDESPDMNDPDTPSVTSAFIDAPP